MPGSIDLIFFEIDFDINSTLASLLDINKMMGAEALPELESADVEDEYCETCVI